MNKEQECSHCPINKEATPPYDEMKTIYLKTKAEVSNCQACEIITEKMLELSLQTAKS